MYVSPRLIPLVLPLTILVTSLMVFGSFSENYEFASMVKKHKINFIGPKSEVSITG